MFNNIYEGKKVFLTGHTGFKGSWLRLWLEKLGAEVCGYSLYPTSFPNHYELLYEFSLNSSTETLLHQNILNIENLNNQLKKFKPDIVFHLAAQPLVLESYKNPTLTFATNAMGTLNILEACKEVKPKAIVVITTDKVYEDQNKIYTETDKLLGYDPYSASKVCAEVIVDSYRKSFLNKLNINVATARAGNIIGGGDWAENRIIPDLIRAYEKNKKLILRNPYSIRPWQFILDCLYGYLLMGKALLEDKKIPNSLNFGPSLGSTSITTSSLIEQCCYYWSALTIYVERINNVNQFHETNSLRLDSSNARIYLNWYPKLTIQESIQWAIEWYKEYYITGKIITLNQINKYCERVEK
jgi:CDP-glucose 4,6-dehydratase